MFLNTLDPQPNIEWNESINRVMCDFEDNAQDGLEVRMLKKRKCERGVLEFNQAISEYCLALAIIGHEFPFTIGESHTFREFVHKVQPLFRFVDTKSIKSKCMMVCEVEKLKLQMMLGSLDCQITITCDV